MADTIKTIKSNAYKLMKMAASELADSIHFYKSSRKFDKSTWDADEGGHKPGDKISVRIPAHYTVGTTFDLTGALQDIKEDSVHATADIVASIGTDLDSLQLATDVDLGTIYERFIQQQISDMAASIESTMVTRAAQLCPNIVGTPGTTTFDTDLILSAGEKMSKGLAPKSNRFFLGDSTSMRSAVNARKGLFNDQAKLAEQYKEGVIGKADGFTWLENELIYRHTNGADVAFAVEATVVAIATGMSTLGVDGVTSGATIKKGTKFTLPGVYAVHPQTKANLGYLQQFTVTADVTEAAGNSVTLAIYPTIYSAASGSLQNVSALPTDEDAVTVLTGSASTTYAHSLAFHKEAFRVGSLPLVMPTAVEFAEQATEDGVTVSIIRAFDTITRKMVTRVDFLGILVPARPSWASVLTA